jgi:hypothetical protein
LPLENQGEINLSFEKSLMTMTIGTVAMRTAVTGIGESEPKTIRFFWDGYAERERPRVTVGAARKRKRGGYGEKSVPAALTLVAKDANEGAIASMALGLADGASPNCWAKPP